MAALTGKARALAKTLVNFRQYDEAFICGPSAMMDEAEAALQALGMPEKAIHLERFNTPGTAVKRTASVQADGQKVTVRQDGRDREITLTADDESILDAALRQGADLPLRLQGRRMRHLQMQSAAWESRYGDQLQPGAGRAGRRLCAELSGAAVNRRRYRRF